MTQMFSPKEFKAAPIPVGSLANVSRRFVLKGLVGTGALVVGTSILPQKSLAAWWLTGAGDMAGGVVTNPHVFVSIAPNGTVTIIAHRVEMGTGIRTSLPMVVADEMEADWARVHVQQADGDDEKYGNENTDGSRSIRHFLNPMRQIGASVRKMLEEAAAKEWGVDPATVRAENHEVHGPSGQKIGYGELAAAASALPVPSPLQIRLKKPEEFRYIGKGNVPIVDLRDITMGRAVYGIDSKIPGMKFAVIARPPVIGGKLVKFDASEALKVPGVEKVVEVQGWPWPSKFQPLGGVAVVARNTGSAIKGREKLKIDWDLGPNVVYDTATYKKQLAETASQPGKVIREDGDAEKALKSAAKVVSAQYYIPHHPHASMEPPSATVYVKDGKCVAYAATQSPGDCRVDLAKTLGIPKENVTVHVPLLGGAFGRKSKYDYVLEAALVSRSVGAPIKVTWTREDDLHLDFFNITTVEQIDVGLDKNDKLIAWRHRSVGPTILSTFVKGADYEFNIEQGLGLIDTPYYVPNLRLEVGKAEAHTRIGWFRSVTNIPHAFAMQSMVGELAAALGRDQKEMLLEVIGPSRIVDVNKSKYVKDWWNYGDPPDTWPVDAGRLRHVTEVAANMAGWGKTLPKGEALGIAAHRSFQSYVATVVHVAVDGKGGFTVPAVYTAIDCGFFVNPERIHAQIEGAAVQGLAIAKNANVEFVKGVNQLDNFDKLSLARINEAPLNVKVHIVPANPDMPACGVGEPGVPPFAPALCNAIYAATGKRIRNLPIANQLAT